MLTNRQYETVGLRFVIDRLECHSYFGKEEIRALNAKIHEGIPLAKLREDVHEAFYNINELIKLTDKQRAALQEHLQKFKNIRGCVKKLENTIEPPTNFYEENIYHPLKKGDCNLKGNERFTWCGSYLSEVDIFELKGFLLAQEQFCFFWNNLSLSLSSISFSDMTKALDILDKNKLRTAPFHIPHEDLPELLKVRQEKEKIENMIHKNGLTPELDSKRSVWVQKEDELERQVLKELTYKLRPYTAEFLTNAKNIGKLDFLLAKAVLAIQTGAVCPVLVQETICFDTQFEVGCPMSGQATLCQKNNPKSPKTAAKTMRFVNMWNPYTKEALQKNGKEFTKISIELPPGCAVITGANMGGKSIAIKTVLLNVALANMGFFVFAEEASVPVFEDLYMMEEETGDNFLSSFGAEVMQINHIVKKIDHEKLFIAIDEPARATNPNEGTKIARGLVSYLENQKSTALVSTHYDDVHKEAGTHYQTAGYKAGVKTNLDDLKNSVNYELIKVDKCKKVPAEAINLCEILGLHAPLLAEIRKMGV